MNKIFITLIMPFLFVTQINAQQAGTKARLTFEHWNCSILIQFMNDSDQKKLAGKGIEHFEKGYKYVLEMYKELENPNTNQEKNWSENAPLFFRWAMPAPNHEFGAGRLYEATNQNTGDEVSKDSNGEYIDQGLWPGRAKNTYNERNCKILN
mgnify:CR=1 FL=1|tara:strand:+ start:108 stop:563 length:456 start_codon:yes stop_codon:yes gene_type:complete